MSHLSSGSSPQEKLRWRKQQQNRADSFDHNLQKYAKACKHRHHDQNKNNAYLYAN